MNAVQTGIATDNGKCSAATSKTLNAPCMFKRQSRPMWHTPNMLYAGSSGASGTAKTARKTAAYTSKRTYARWNLLALPIAHKARWNHNR